MNPVVLVMGQVHHRTCSVRPSLPWYQIKLLEDRNKHAQTTCPGSSYKIQSAASNSVVGLQAEYAAQYSTVVVYAPSRLPCCTDRYTMSYRWLYHVAQTDIFIASQLMVYSLMTAVCVLILNCMFTADYIQS